jgi:hypothetical protein
MPPVTAELLIGTHIGITGSPGLVIPDLSAGSLSDLKKPLNRAGRRSHDGSSEQHCGISACFSDSFDNTSPVVIRSIVNSSIRSIDRGQAKEY